MTKFKLSQEQISYLERHIALLQREKGNTFDEGMLLHAAAVIWEG